MAVQAGLCQIWSDIPKTGFLVTRLNYRKDPKFLDTHYLYSRPAKAPRIDIFFCIATKKRSIFCSSKRIDGQDHPLERSFVKCRLSKILSFTENVLDIFFQRFSFKSFSHSSAIYNIRSVENAVHRTKRMSKIMNLR